MSESATAAVRVWRQPDRMWRWRWVQCDEAGNEQASLTSHMAFESASEAGSSAREAYPDVAVHMPGDVARTPRRRRRRFLLALSVVAVAALSYRAGRRRGPAVGPGAAPHQDLPPRPDLGIATVARASRRVAAPSRPLRRT